MMTEAVNICLHTLIFVGVTYIGLESLFSGVVETDALAFRMLVGHS